MISWNRAAREVVRVFSTQNQHIAVVFGKKPRNCAGIELVEIGPNPKVPIFVVQCRPLH